KGRRLPNLRLPTAAGLTGHMLKARQPILFRSVEEWPEGVVHFGDGDGVQSVLAVPLQVGERVFGVLTTQAYQPHAFSAEDEPLLALLANQAASAIQNARLFQSVQRQLSQLSILHEVARAAVAAADLDHVIAQALEVLRRRVGYPRLDLYLLNPARDR